MSRFSISLQETSGFSPRSFIWLFAVLCIIYIFLPSFSFAQEPAQKTPDTTSSVENQTKGSELASKEVVSQDESQTTSPASEEATEPKNITSIEIKGNKSISTNTIVSKMKSKVGRPYQENVVSDDLRRLYLLGFFEDIRFDTEDYNGGFKLVVTLKERPIIEKIVFGGIGRLTMKDEKLKGQLKSKESQYVDYPSLSEDTRTIKKMYEKLGYSDAEVKYQITTSEESNKAKVEFVVIEGTRIRIKAIRIQGNTAYPARRILRLIKTRQAWLFNAGVLKEDVLREDIERIKSFYQRQGYADVAVDYSVEEKTQAKRRFLYINIKIIEAKKYLAGNVVVQGNREISQKEILAKLTECVPGKVFSQEALKQDTTSIQSLYFDKGYIFAQVQETTALNPQTGRIDIAYSISENQVAYVDKIKVRGNIKTRDVVIRRELRIRPGDRFDGEKLKRSKERLQNLGFFEDVGYDIEEDKAQAPDRRNLVVEVKESKTGAFSFGGGYSTVDDFIGFVEIEQKNFDWKNFPYFSGAGQDLRFRATFGTVSNAFDLSFTNPWVFDYPVSFGFDGYRREHKRDTDVGYGYDEKITGGDVRLGREISDYMRADLMYRLDRLNISNISGNASHDLWDEEGKTTIGSITPSFSYDSRDSVFDTRKGRLLTASVDCAGGALGGDKDYNKFFTRASQYLPLPWNSALEARLRIGLAKPYSDTKKIPIYERFFAGGADTIRGYNERKVGPVDPSSDDPLGGESLLIGNLEYIYPLFNFFKIAAFFDVGNVWEKMGKFGSSGGYKSAIGLGLRLKTPIGPVRLDYGIPFNKEVGKERRSNGRFHFSASHGF